MKKLIITLAFIWSVSVNVLSAQMQTASSADIYLQLKKLNVCGSVLYIAAHPDDENTRLLAYLAQEKQYHTGYLSLTRGDGGQNLVGDEQGVDLGLMRTQELLSARSIDGAEQFFSRAYDFGFSKTADETLSIWDKEKILSDIVWVIRKFRPDIIITRFPADSRAGHGHHAASALLANEAFAAAADTKKFSDQFKYGVKPWQAKRILWNTFNFGSNNTTAPDQFKIDIGTYNPVLGKSYGEIASESRSRHKSQGFGVARQRGQAYEFFVTVGGEAPSVDLMDGVDITWSRISDNNNISQQVDAIVAAYNINHPEKSLPALINLYTQINQLPDSYRKNKKLNEVQQLIIACGGLFAEATVSKEYAVQGEMIPVQFFVNSRNDTAVSLKKVTLNGFDTSIQTLLSINKNISFNHTVSIAKDHPTSRPYWLSKPMQPGYFEVDHQELIGKAENGAALEATFTFAVRDIELVVNCPVKYKYTDPVKGELYQPLNIISPVSITAEPAVLLTNIHPENEVSNHVPIQIHYKAYFSQKAVAANIALLQNGNTIFSKDTTIDFEQEKTYTISVPVSELKMADITSGHQQSIKAQVKINNGVYDQYLRQIQYDYIPDIAYTYTNKIKILPHEIKTNGKRRVGYIAGAGDKVPDALLQMEYEVIFLTEKEITPQKLSEMDAVITGIRAYNIHAYLSEKYEILMRYVANGGNLIVQYNTNSQIGPVKSRIAPYPLTIGRTRVTDEKAKINFLLPNHSVFNYPNKITSTDFDGWVQERSIYQAEQLDSRYTAPLGMNDKGEAESNGSLVIAAYGKGNFVYTGLVFFRELPAGVCGAYKLMANLIALP